MKISQSMEIKISVPISDEGSISVSTHDDGLGWVDIVRREDSGKELSRMTFSLSLASELAGAIVKVVKHNLDEEAKG